MTLKHIHTIFLLCCLALLLPGCHTETEISAPLPEDSPLEARFGVASLASRGVAIVDASEIQSMGVFAYSTGNEPFDPANTTHRPNLMHNRQLTREEPGEDGVATEWTYSPIVYWPMDLTNKNSFFAYAPHSSLFHTQANVQVSAASASGYPTLTYTIPEDITEQYDILYAAPVLDKNRLSDDEEAHDGKVFYQMKHALTWLAFVIAPVPSLHHEDYPNESYTVNWLEFMATNLTNRATLNLGTGGWTSNAKGSVNYEFELIEEAAANIKPGETARIIDPESRLMLFPFEINDDTEATIDLTFIYDPGDPDSDIEIEEFYYYMPFPTTRMTAGNVIVYVINISTEGASVHFLKENRIEEWLEGEAKEVEIF